MTDVSVSVVALLLLSPMLLVLAMLVKFSGPGPIFFRQERIGRHGQPFWIIKFRSMIYDAESNGCLLYTSRCV